MKLSIEELLKGLATKIKDKEFFETKAYVEPFLERASKLTDNFEVNVKLPDQITVTKKEDLDFDNITYNRVWIQAILPEEYTVENHAEVLGMVYGIDTRKPIIKFYRGGLNMACTNLCVFNPAMLSVQEFKPQEAINYKPLDSILSKTLEIQQFLSSLHNVIFPRNYRFINEQLGKWIRNALNLKYENGISPVKLGVPSVVDAYKLLFEDTKSPYFVPTNSEGTNMFNVYNAFTEIISNKDNKDIINKCEKTLLLKSILGID